MNFQTLFGLGMKRYLPDLLYPEGISYDLGASGKYVAPGAMPLGPPQWIWPRNRIPAGNNSVAHLHAYHFLEHLHGGDVVSLLQEAERVLIPEAGVLSFSVPYYTGTLAVHDLTHKSFWCEDTFKNLFEDDSYDRGNGTWKLRVHFQLICGLAQRNLALVGQLIKSDRPAEDRPKWFYPEAGR